MIFTKINNRRFSRSTVVNLGLVFLLTMPSLFALGEREIENEPDLVIINMADTHSAYDRYPAILKGIEDLSTRYTEKTMVILFDGDLFESGNSVAMKSEGTVDLEFIRRLGEYGKVIINVGNHEFDLSNPEEFRSKVESTGAHVIGTVASEGDNELPSYWDILLEEKRVRIIGVGVDALNTYPKELRESLTIPEPVEWMENNYDSLSEGADSVIVASHSGLVADLSMLDYLGTKDNLLYMVGAHDHITLKEEVNGIPYMHNGFKGEQFNVTEISFVEDKSQIDFTDVITNEIEGEDDQLKAFIKDARETFLSSEDLEIVGTVPENMNVLEGALWAVETIRKATGGDVAFLNHTSFGSGLAQGPLSRYRYNQFMRFDNNVMTATVDGETLSSILSLCNQQDQKDIHKRSGDFLYAGTIDVDESKTYTIVTSSWVALDFNQMKYLGINLEFTQIPDITTKGLLEAELN
jgi:5'-nucleotidase / UDP-sugar diphosphatase